MKTQNKLLETLSHLNSLIYAIYFTGLTMRVLAFLFFSPQIFLKFSLLNVKAYFEAPDTYSNHSNR